MPRIRPDDHLRRDWRVHAVARDFELLDVWEYPIRAVPGATLADFVAVTGSVEGEVVGGRDAAGLLFRLRLALGRLLGWDDPGPRLPIPGCTETSVRDRLPPEDQTPAHRSDLGFETVYAFGDELLNEVSNRTVHALMHVSWIDQDDGTHVPRMAVYVKPRGILGRLYMALIGPFRHLVVYPTLMRRVGEAWAAAHPDAAGQSPTA